VNVTLRQSLDLFANVRPIKSLPKVDDRFVVDMVIVRENTEGLYAGLELMIMPGIAQSIKLTTEKNSVRIARFAFEYARSHGRNLVSIAHKANILKISDGLALDAARRVAAEYEDITLREIIVDAAAMTMVRNPNSLGVLVTENLYGDVLSDLGAGLVGGLGFVPGANIGEKCAVFEAVHGTAPDIAGQGLANPSGLTLSAALMLDHIGQPEAAERVRAGIYAALGNPELRTGDLGGKATTRQLTDGVVAAIEAG
jgi:isocitrate dehydrogenase (NAD+)